MRDPPHLFAEFAKKDLQYSKLMYELPDFFLGIIASILKNSDPIYITDENISPRRVITQTFLKIYQDTQCIINLIRMGYSTQANTLDSSLMETTYFIYYAGLNPEKANEWLSHDEYKWSDNFNNWLTSTLAYMVKIGEITKKQRTEHEEFERYTYSILCASKHNNGFILKKTNIVMIESGRPELVIAPAFTYFSSSECAYPIVTSLRLAVASARYYCKWMGFSSLPPIVDLMLAEAFRIGKDVMNSTQDFTRQPRA